MIMPGGNTVVYGLPLHLLKRKEPKKEEYLDIDTGLMVKETPEQRKARLEEYHRRCKGLS